MNESFKTDPSLATSARAANESGSYLCASNVTPTAVRFIVSVFLCLLCSCRMSSTQMTCSHLWKNRPKKRQKPAGCRSRIISKNRPVPIFGRSTGASLIRTASVCAIFARFHHFLFNFNPSSYFHQWPWRPLNMQSYGKRRCVEQTQNTSPTHTRRIANLSQSHRMIYFNILQP